jgi:hypothetical protein
MDQNIKLYEKLIKLIDNSLTKEMKKGIPIYLKFEYGDPITNYCSKYNIDERAFYDYFLNNV